MCLRGVVPLSSLPSGAVLRLAADTRWNFTLNNTCAVAKPGPPIFDVQNSCETIIISTQSSNLQTSSDPAARQLQVRYGLWWASKSLPCYGAGSLQAAVQVL